MDFLRGFGFNLVKKQVLFLLVLVSGLSWGQSAIPNTTPVTQNFDGMAATTTLPSNWRMHASTASPTWSGASSSLTQQASLSSPTTGGTYNFGSSTTERAAGAMTSSGFASPNSLVGFFQNTNAANLTSLTISYDAERYRINTAAASVQFFYSLNGSTWLPITAGDVAASSFPTGTSAYNFASGTIVNITGISITGLSIANNSTIYLRWNINTTGGNSQGIAIDNVSITAAFAAPTSSSSGVTVGASLEPASFPSTTTALTGATSPQTNAVVNFDFTVTDDANTAGGDDTLPTLISQISIPQGAGNDIANWTQAIAGAQLSDGTNTINGTIAASTLTFASIPTSGGALGEITDGSAKTYSLRIWLNTTLGGTLPTTIDGLNLALKIDRTNFTTASAATSTQFESGAGTAVESGSTNNAVDVVATNLNFVAQPTNVNQNATMSPAVTISANDPNGNRDLNYTSNVSLTSTGTMTVSPIAVAAAAGVATYSGIVHSVPASGLFLSATSGSLTASGNSSSFNVIALTPTIGVTSQIHNSTSAFGNVVLGSTFDRTFTINNTGSAVMTISSLTFGGSGFAIQGATPTTVGVGGNATFTVRFTPNAIGAFIGTVTINNDSSNQTAYIINFTGTGTPSILSDSILSGMAYSSNIDYTTSQAVAPLTNTTGSVEVMGITIRDGGASASDADVLPTILTGITFSSITGTNRIRTAALFDGSTMVANNPTINVGANTIAFSGFSYSCNDNSTRDLTLRISFLTTVTDNLQMTFTVTNANVAAAGSNTSSTFAAFSSVVSSTTGDRNRIEVTADRLAFVQQPSNTGINAVMSPAVTVSANDSNNNRDLDFTNAVNITSTGTLTITPNTANAVAGLATFSAITHNVVGFGLTLNAASGSLTDATSTTFNIVLDPSIDGDYRTMADGSWHGTPASNTSQWQRKIAGVWTDIAANTVPSNNTINTFFIRHNISLIGNNTTKNIVVENGAIFNTGTGSLTFKNVNVKSGGTFTKQATSLRFDSDGTLEVENGGTFNYSHTNTTSRTSNLWAGTEKFHPNSNFIVKETDTGGGNLIIENAADVSLFNGAMFGNFIVDTGVLGGPVPFFVAGLNTKLTNGDFILRTGSDAGMMFSNGNYSVTIGGNLTIESTYIRAFTITNSASVVTFTVNGNIVHNGSAEFRLANSQTNNNPSVTLNIDGNLTLGTSNFNFDIGTSSTGANKSIVNLKGDLTTGTGNISTTNTNAAKRGEFNFSGTYNASNLSTIQTIDVASTGTTTENARVNYNIKSGAYTQLLTSNFELGTDSKLTVENGGTFDFGLNGSNALLVAISGSQTGTAFESMTGSTLKITSPDGITTTATPLVGNVTTATRTFASDASFEYIGNATPQFTGNALPASVRNLVVNNTAVNAIVKLTNSAAVTNNLGLIIGVLETVACNASTSGTPLLTMNAGSFVTPTGGSSASYVSGVMQKVGNTSFKFPIGGNGQYAPLSISGASSVTDSFSTCYNQINPLTAIGTAKAANVNDINNCEYWHLNSIPASIPTQITLDLNDTRCAITSSLCKKVVGWSGFEWQSLGNNADTATSVTSSTATLRGPITWSSNVLSVLPNLAAADTFAKVGFGTHVIPKPNFPGGVSGGFIAFDSDSKGLVIPRVSSANRPTGVAGLLIYNTDINCIQMHNGTFWKCIESSSCGN